MNLNRETRSFLMPRDPSIDRRFRPCPKKRERLFCEIDEENSHDEETDEGEDDEYDTRSSCDVATVDSGALVYLRLKPVDYCSTAYSIAAEGKVLVTVPPQDAASSSKNKNFTEKHYSFSEIFDSNVTQCEVYELCIADKIRAQESLTILTYGTSGSGKTFTLLGDDANPGIIPRSLENIFTLYQHNIYPTPVLKLINARNTVIDDMMAAKEMKLSRQLLDQCKIFENNYTILRQTICNEHKFEPIVNNNDVSVIVYITFVEIYNELVHDLLDQLKVAPNTQRKNLKIVSNDGNVFIKGVNSVWVKTSLDALKLLRFGLQKLTYASTSINANSSRSHCVFVVDVLKYYRSGVVQQISYKFCDLAGSERVDKTGNKGSRLKEAQRINTSLMVLGRCLDAANNLASSSSANVNKKELIPFRESKLTSLLQAALHGKEKLAMIVNVTPTDNFYEENLNVLNFASIASNIIFKAPVVKQNQSRYSAFGITADNTYVHQLLEELATVKAENEQQKDYIMQQKDYIVQQNEHIESLMDEIHHLKEDQDEKLLKLEHDLRNELVDSFKKTMEEHKAQFEQRLQRELESQRKIFESRIEFLKRRHQEELEDLKEEMEDSYNENNTLDDVVELKDDL